MKKLIKQKLLEYLTQSELKSVEQNADNLFSDVNIDFDFTNHFIDRVNDPRNGKEIEPEELNNLFYNQLYIMNHTPTVKNHYHLK